MIVVVYVSDVPKNERDALIRHFNDLGNINSQNSFLSGLISVNAIKQRRPRQAEQNARLGEFSYAYKVRVHRENCLADIPGRFKVFLSIFVSLTASFKQLSLLLPQLEWHQLTSEGNMKRGDETNYLMLHIRRWKSFSNHLRVAKTITADKRLVRKQARKVKEFKAITMDYGKNLTIPNISMGEVYYQRQLSFYHFNVHVLSDGSSTFYTYDQTIAKKGSDEVISTLYNFFFGVLRSNVREIHIFCDSCGGQNNNWTVIRFLQYVAVVLKRFDKVQVTYPIRGHSYMEYEKNVSPISQKTPAETPRDWREAIDSARVKPSPFQVVKCQTDLFKARGKALNQNYSKKFATETRPIKQLIFKAENTQTVQHRGTYNSAFRSTLLVKRQKKKGR
ncbi:hypothetical protein PR048_025664, partial [Dryococelus australis]